MRLKEYRFIKTNNEMWVKINFDKVIYIQAHGNFSMLFFEDEKRVICKSPLIRLQNILPIYFERVHNSYIININYINFIDFNTKIIQLNNKITTKLGNHYKDNIEKYFLNINKQINT